MNITTTPVARHRTSLSSSETGDFVDDRNEFEQKYNMMDIDDMLAATLNMDTECFENTRQFNPRKQRSCHRRSEPVSEERRKEESSKNSREYTKRNRDEIKNLQMMFKDIEAQKNRLAYFMRLHGKEAVLKAILSSVRDFEDIMERYCDVGNDVRKKCNVPNPEDLLINFCNEADAAEKLEFTSGVISYEQKLRELNEQYESLYNTKDSLTTQKDRTNFASSKSRLKQRIVRAQLKTDCYKSWQAIQTMRVQVVGLKTCGLTAKEHIWNNILGVYYNMIKFVKPTLMNVDDAWRIKTIGDYFEPYSKNAGNLFFKWVPSAGKLDDLASLNVSAMENKPETLLSSFQLTPPLPSPNFPMTLPTLPTNKTPTQDLLPNFSPPAWSQLESEEKPPVLSAQKAIFDFDVSRKRSADSIEDYPAKRRLFGENQQLLVPKVEVESPKAPQGLNLAALLTPTQNIDAVLANYLLSANPLNMYGSLGSMNQQSPSAVYMSLLNSCLPIAPLTPQLSDAINHQRLIQMLLNSAFQNPAPNQ